MPEASHLPDISEAWETELLRLTTFLKPNVDVGARDTWWKSVVGDEADKSEIRPKAGTIQQSGIFAGKGLSFAVQPGRVDWAIAEPFDSPEELSERLPTMGSFPTAYERFSTIPKSWFNECPEVARFAFGAILDLPVVDKVAGYQILARILPNIPIDTENSIDFLYQINRPRMSNTVPGLSINRLMKWAVVRLGLIKFGVRPDGQTLSTNLPYQFACRLELDISTDAEFSGDFNSDSMNAVFEEMVSIAKEISANGDIA